MVQLDLCDYTDAYVVVKGTIMLQIQMMMHMIKNWFLKIVLHL